MLAINLLWKFYIKYTPMNKHWTQTFIAVIYCTNVTQVMWSDSDRILVCNHEKERTVYKYEHVWIFMFVVHSMFAMCISSFIETKFELII